jgi:hypothetical protein
MSTFHSKNNPYGGKGPTLSISQFPFFFSKKHEEKGEEDDDGNTGAYGAAVCGMEVEIGYSV